MANALTKFGQLCRDLRSQHDKSMGDQADAFGCLPYEISAIEVGKTRPEREYIAKFVNWLRLSEHQRRDLEKRIGSNVIPFLRAQSGGDRSTSMRLFRKISKMNPGEIRGIKKKPLPLRPQDDGRL